VWFKQVRCWRFNICATISVCPCWEMLL
jgi:hypothetical protein